MHDLAKVLNHGNSIVIDKKGVEPNLYQGSSSNMRPIPVMAAAYLGKDPKPIDYQRRITAPSLEDMLVEKAEGYRIILSICDIGGIYQLKCLAQRNNEDDRVGYYRLKINDRDSDKMTSDPKEGSKMIGMAIFEALTDRAHGKQIVDSAKMYPIASLPSCEMDRIMALG